MQSAQPPPAAAAESQAKAATPPPADARFAELATEMPLAMTMPKSKLTDASANRGRRRHRAIARRNAKQTANGSQRQHQLHRLRPQQPHWLKPRRSAQRSCASRWRRSNVSPDPNRRWRSTTPGTIEFTQDGGRTWIPVRLNASEVAIGGASPAPVPLDRGPRGAGVAGHRWQFHAAALPERIDLVSVTAADARRATVTT